MASPACESANDYDGRLGLRISSIFVILVGSGLGAVLPVLLARHGTSRVIAAASFIAKYFGSGVIVATAFIHLLAPAHEALTNDCLTGPITEYPWVEAICVMSIFSLFIVELLAMRYAKFGHEHSHDHGRVRSHDMEMDAGVLSTPAKFRDEVSSTELSSGLQTPELRTECPTSPYVPGDDHLSHARDHPQSPTRGPTKAFDPESYGAKMTALFILEFGVIFHSVFIGLTLAVTGSNFITLYVVLALHQTFEGLALGSRLGSTEWPASKRPTPYFMALGYAVTTPTAIAIGLGLSSRLNPGSATALIVNGVFDSISAGILIYTGLVELMAHEFMFSLYMQNAPLWKLLAAVGCMATGALLMAVLGKWA